MTVFPSLARDSVGHTFAGLAVTVLDFAVLSVTMFEVAVPSVIVFEVSVVPVTRRPNV